MRKRSLQNSELDRIGKRLIESGRLNDSEIEQIAESPQLYSAIKARIRTEAVRGAGRRRFIFSPVFAVSCGAILLVLGAVGFAMIWRTENAVVSLKEVKVPAETPENARPVSPPKQFVDDSPNAGRAQTKPISAQKASIRNRNPQGRKAIAELEPNLEFYPITYTGDSNETARGGRIIRVDMPRSALFALGMNVPLENGADMIKADLLVGSDGVPRAIRVVN